MLKIVQYIYIYIEGESKFIVAFEFFPHSCLAL